MWVQNTLTKKWEKGEVKSQAETPRSYIVITSQGEKRRNGIHLRETGISTNTVPMASNVEKVKYVLLAPNKSPSVKKCVSTKLGKSVSVSSRKCAKSKCAMCVKAKGEISA